METKLKLMRVKNKMTQFQLAKILGCSTSMIGSIESGHRNISKSMAVKLSKYFKTSIEYWIIEDAILNLSMENKFKRTQSTLTQLLSQNELNKNSEIQIKINSNNINPEVIKIIEDLVELDIKMLLQGV